MTMKMMLVALCALTAVVRLNAADPQENKDATKDSKEVAAATADKSGSNEAADENKTAEAPKAEAKDAK